VGDGVRLGVSLRNICNCKGIQEKAREIATEENNEEFESGQPVSQAEIRTQDLPEFKTVLPIPM
jgi:hypothetical protein